MKNNEKEVFTVTERMGVGVYNSKAIERLFESIELQFETIGVLVCYENDPN
jgi:hypothetical protein